MDKLRSVFSAFILGISSLFFTAIFFTKLSAFLMLYLNQDVWSDPFIFPNKMYDEYKSIVSIIWLLFYFCFSTFLVFVNINFYKKSLYFKALYKLILIILVLLLGYYYFIFKNIYLLVPITLLFLALIYEFKDQAIEFNNKTPYLKIVSTIYLTFLLLGCIVFFVLQNHSIKYKDKIKKDINSLVVKKDKLFKYKELDCKNDNNNLDVEKLFSLLKHELEDGTRKYDEIQVQAKKMICHIQNLEKKHEYNKSLNLYKRIFENIKNHNNYPIDNFFLVLINKMIFDAINTTLNNKTISKEYFKGLKIVIKKSIFSSRKLTFQKFIKSLEKESESIKKVDIFEYDDLEKAAPFNLSLIKNFRDKVKGEMIKRMESSQDINTNYIRCKYENNFNNCKLDASLKYYETSSTSQTLIPVFIYFITQIEQYNLDMLHHFTVVIISKILQSVGYPKIHVISNNINRVIYQYQDIEKRLEQKVVGLK